MPFNRPPCGARKTPKIDAICAHDVQILWPHLIAVTTQPDVALVDPYH
jgi:hypothetical protein